MRKVIRHLAILLLGFASCNKAGPLSPIQYVSYCEDADHELKKKVQIGNIEYVIQLATPEYMAAQAALNEQGIIDPAILSSRLQELKGYTFFLIRMGEVRGDQDKTAVAVDPGNTSAMLSYYAEHAAADIILKIGKATLRPSAYHFEDNYRLTPYNTLVAGFQTGDQPDDMRIVFNDRYRNNPMVRASFSKAQLQDIPLLQTH